MSRSTILLLTSALLSASLIAQDTAPAPQLLAQTGRAADKKAAPAGGDATEPAVTATPTPAARRNARSTPAPAPGAVPEATPEPKRPGFFERVFGRKRPQGPVATPAPATPAPATPRPRRPRPKTTPPPAEAKPAETGSEEKRAEAKPNEKPADTEAKPDQPAEATAQPEKPTDSAPVAEAPMETPPAPERPAATPATTKKGKRAEAAAKAAAAKAAAAQAAAEKKPEPPADADPETLEKWKYDQAKATAQQDGEVLALKEKADGAPSDDEARKALRAYNKALFARMRKADPSIKERVDRMETAVLKRLEEKASE